MADADADGDRKPIAGFHRGTNGRRVLGNLRSESEDLTVAIAAVRSGKFLFELSDDGLHWRIMTPDGTVLKGEGDL